MNSSRFKDRTQAGRLLAGALLKFADRNDVIVLGLPRGGVPVAWEVARRLHAPLDVIMVRKLGLPGWEELAMGAIASGGVRVINEQVVKLHAVSQAAIDAAAAAQLKELRRREGLYRGHSGAPDVGGKTVILVDDGIATGSTLRSAVEAIRVLHPAQIVVAAPVAARDSCDQLERLADQVVTLLKPENFRAVGEWYEDFDQTRDAEVSQLLGRALDEQC